MCGIAGVVLQEPGSERELARIGAAMAATLAHRGPDGQGVWVHPASGVALAHRRLAIIDLSPTGAQPMVDASGRYILVYNGELYNYRELRRGLEARGVAFRGTSDTEVLLEVYARDGERCLTQLNGMFAFAIWDSKERELLLVRDGFGIKPLYYAEQPNGFLFASELKAIVPWLESCTLDVAALARYVTYLWCPGAGTPLAEVRKLGPGEALVVRGGRITRHWTWYQPPQIRGVPANVTSPQEAAHLVRGGLQAAVRRQLIADVPVGAFLSGGLDSSAVVALARDSAPDLHCFTIELAGGHDVGFADDLPFARQAAQSLGVRLEVVKVEASRMAQDVPEMVAQLDEPLADPAALNVRYISELARRQGVPVLLSGAGGDDLFTGYRRHALFAAERLWRGRFGPARTVLVALARRIPASTGLGRRLQAAARQLSASANERSLVPFEWIARERVASLFAPGLRPLIGDIAEPMRRFEQALAPELPALERLLALEQRFFLADHNLAYTDRMSMAAGVEVRVPYLDLQLVELAAQLPPHLKQRGRIGKWVLKEAMRPVLPPQIIHRPKTGFGAPLRRWLAQDLRTLAEELLSARVQARRGLFDAGAIARLRSEHEAGRADAAYTLFAVMAIELWCQRYVDGRASERVRGI